MQALENYYFGGGAKNDALWKEGIEYFENIQSKTKSLDGATSSVNKAVAAMNKLTMTGDDLTDVQRLLMATIQTPPLFLWRIMQVLSVQRMFKIRSGNL